MEMPNPEISARLIPSDNIIEVTLPSKASYSAKEAFCWYAVDMKWYYESFSERLEEFLEDVVPWTER